MPGKNHHSDPDLLLKLNVEDSERVCLFFSRPLSSGFIITTLTRAGDQKVPEGRDPPLRC